MERVSRRRLLFGVGALVCVSGRAGAAAVVAAQTLTPVRLLVLRRLGLSPSGQCSAPCIRGSIYDMSDLGERALDDSLIAAVVTRTPICDVIERPWKNNAPNVSAIPRGVYGALIRDEPTKTWMTNANRAWRLELSGTAHRTNVQFHYGQDVAWSEGCLIVGALLQKSDTKGVADKYCAVSDGEAAVAALRAAVTAPGRNIKDIKVGIADHAGLFPNFQGNSPCP